MNLNVQVFISLFSNIILIISILILWRQVIEMKKQIQSSVYQNIVRTFDEFSYFIIQNPDLSNLIFNENYNLKELQAKWLIFTRLDWYETIVIQKYKFNSIPDDVYQHWMSILKYEINLPFIKEIWLNYKDFYHKLLCKEIDKILIKPMENY